MNICNVLGDPERGKFSGSKKNSLPMKDVKRKLSCINRRINDLHHQRKFVYKNSVKVKKMVHNQINQIVKCFRARERTICSDVDEVYFSHDANISDELSRLQSVYSHCQALFNNMEDFKEKSAVLRKIDIILSEINLGEKPDVKPFEFLSDFEMMKVKANSYGYLEGDFVKKDEFVYISEEKDNKLSADNCKMFHSKDFLNQIYSASSNPIVSSQKGSLYKTTDTDDFQIIDLLDNMCCQDNDDDSIMDEDTKVNVIPQIENKLNELPSSTSEDAFRSKEYSTSKSSSANHEINDFNAEEEWKELLEMNKKLVRWHEMTSKETLDDSKGKEKSYDKNCNPKKVLLLRETNEWLHNSKCDKLGKEKTFDKTKSEITSTSPAEIIKKSFKLYLAKDCIQNWLSTD